jgi:uncharacterized membrane protein YedE/YeeE
MENFTPYSALFGGALIGISATLLLLCNGKIAGISSIIGGLFRFPSSEVSHRFIFLAGLIAGGLILLLIHPNALEIKDLPRSPSSLIVAGLLVGFGTRMGSGCTSGHGVCGMSRMSKRSIVATLIFMAAGFVTVGFITNVTGGML